LGWARTYILARVSERIGADLRTATFEHLMKQSLEYFGGKRTGDLMARIGAETDRINVFLSLHLLDFATDVLMIVMTAIILFSINPWLALVTLLPLPVIAWMIHTVRDRLRTGFEKVDRVWGEVTNVLADTIPGIRVVKAFAQEARETQRFRDANRRNLEVNDRVNRVWSLFGPTVTLLTEVGLLFVWAFGIWQVANDHITVGVLTAFIAYISRFYLRLDSMSRIVSVTQKAAAGAKRIFDILDHVSSVPEPSRPEHLERVEGPHRTARRGLPLRQPRRAARRRPGHRAGRNDRAGRSQRFRQEHAGEPDQPLLRRVGRQHPDRRHRHPRAAGGRIPPPHRSGAAGALPVLRHHRRQHRLRQARCRVPRSLPPRVPRTPTNSSCACRTATTRWWASAARRCRGASVSASRLRARC
jgi:ABC-type multidrug transport system fused ATPase/permease subunit